MSGCDSRPPRQFPISRAPACAAESPKLSLPGAAPGRLANSSWGRGRKVMHLPCKQAPSGSVTRRPPPSFAWNPSTRGFQAKDVLHRLGEGGLFIILVLYCGKLDQSTERSLISFFRWVRLPLPLPISGKRSGCPTVNRVSQNKVGSDELERYQRFPPSFA